jgi:hypothetical protein
MALFSQYMGVLDRNARNPLGYRPETLALSKMMQTFLINYDNTGNPNEGTRTSFPLCCSNCVDIHTLSPSDSHQPLLA